MKQCPKCQASISDTAKFCMECGCNIKKYEEEKAQPKARFCPECGTEIPRGSFCPECGYNIDKEPSAVAEPSVTDTFGDAWLSDIENSTSAEMANLKAQRSRMDMEQALAVFEYEEHTDGTYTITGLKDKGALNITVPKGVIAIAEGAFQETQVFSVSLPEGLLKIGANGFSFCKDLTTINIPSTLRMIGDQAFYGCSMLDVEIPFDLCKVGSRALYGTATYNKEKAKYGIGVTVTFGSYYQNTTDKKEPIEWVVLKSDAYGIFMISKYALEIKCFDANSGMIRNSGSLYYDSTVHDWIHNVFIKEAFNEAERRKIDILMNEERVDLLGCDQLQFVPINLRECKATSYALKDLKCNSCVRWWLSSEHPVSHLPVTISEKGNVEWNGYRMTDLFGIRPTILITNEKLC